MFRPGGKPGGEVKVWDAQTREREVLSLKGHVPVMVNGVAYSPDGKRIVTGSVGKIRTAKVWDADKGIEKLFTLEGAHRTIVSSCVRGVRTANASSREARTRRRKLWDAVTGTEEVLSLKGYAHGPGQDSVCVESGRQTHRHRQWGPDGEGVGRGQGDRGTPGSQRATQDRVSLRSVQSPTANASSPAVLTKTAKVWDAETRAQERSLSFKGHTIKRCTAVAFSR